MKRMLDALQVHTCMKFLQCVCIGIRIYVYEIHIQLTAILIINILIKSIDHGIPNSGETRRRNTGIGSNHFNSTVQIPASFATRTAEFGIDMESCRHCTKWNLCLWTGVATRSTWWFHDASTRTWSHWFCEIAAGKWRINEKILNHTEARRTVQHKTRTGQYFRVHYFVYFAYLMNIWFLSFDFCSFSCWKYAVKEYLWC